MDKIERKTFIDFTEIKKDAEKKSEEKSSQKLFEQIDGEKADNLNRQIVKISGANGSKLNISDSDIDMSTTKSLGEEGGNDFEVTTKSAGEEGGNDFEVTTKSAGEEGGDLENVQEFIPNELTQASPEELQQFEEFVVSDRSKEGGEASQAPQLPEGTVVSDRSKEGGEALDTPQLPEGTVVSDRSQEGGEALENATLTNVFAEGGENSNLLSETFDFKEDYEYQNKIQEQLEATREIIQKMRENKIESFIRMVK